MHTPNAPPAKSFIFIDQMRCCARLEGVQGKSKKLHMRFSQTVNECNKIWCIRATATKIPSPHWLLAVFRWETAAGFNLEAFSGGGGHEMWLSDA